MKQDPLNSEATHVNVAMPLELLASLMAEGHVCAVDLTALDAPSHQALHRLLLTVCAQKLQGYARQCDACQAQNQCQQMTQLGLAEPQRVAQPASWQLH